MSLPKPLARNGSASTSNTGSRGSSDATGSWNTTCRSPRSACRPRLSSVATSAPSTSMRPGLRCGEVQNLVQRRRLAGTRLADDAQCAALLQFEADPVDGAHLADPAAEHHALGQRVGLDQIVDAQHDRFLGGRARISPSGCRGHAVDLGRAATGDVFASDARDLVARTDRCQFRFGGVAGRRAASGQRGSERAARRQRRQRRGSTRDGHQPFPLGRVQARHRARADRRCRASGGCGTDRRPGRSPPPGPRTSPARGRRTRRRRRGRG